MRKRFEQQMELGVLPISETPVLKKSRDATPALIKTLLEIYKTPVYADKILSILEQKISKGKKKTGRKGFRPMANICIGTISFRIRFKLRPIAFYGKCKYCLTPTTWDRNRIRL